MALGVCFTVNAQKMETDPIRDSKVLDTTTAKKGQGCIKMTRGTWMPLDAKKCDDLFSKNERLKVVFVSPNGKVKIYDPIIKIDEKWYLYEDEKGKLTWKIPKK